MGGWTGERFVEYRAHFVRAEERAGPEYWPPADATPYDTAGSMTEAKENPVARISDRLLAAGILLLLSSAPVEAQYRRQIEELPPILATSVSFGLLLPYEETVTPIVTPPPDVTQRTRRDVGLQPSATASVRYGRGIALYGSGTVAFGGTADLSGTDPVTAAPVSGSEDVGLVYMVSAGASFQPIREAVPVRIEVGPALMDLGDGGSYLGLRLALAFRFLEIGSRGGVFLDWDGVIAGGQDDQDEVEYQIRRGLVQGVRVGFELDF